MDDLIEFLLELMFDAVDIGLEEAERRGRISKWVRFGFGAVLWALLGALIGLMVFLCAPSTSADKCIAIGMLLTWGIAGAVCLIWFLRKS